MRPHQYVILVDGDLRATDRAWLADLVVGPPVGSHTALRGDLDQAGLFGVLRRLQYLALDVVEVRRMCGCVGSAHSSLSVRESAS